MVDQDGGHYNLEAVRQLLLASFTAEELRRFCFDRDTFRSIVHKFGPKYNVEDMADEVLFYCEPRGLLDQLVVAVREVNPRQFAHFETLLNDPNYKPPVGTQEQPLLPLRKLGEFIKQAILGDSEAVRALRNRQAMLQLVRNTWVKGVLEQSLHGAAMIELGMEERAEAVERPWDMVVQMPGQANRQLPHGSRMIDVFDEANHSLLILGEPGSGKTTMLLTLARDSIHRAEQDPTPPIPVVFNLSSWAAKREPIAEWLVEELRSKYHVGKKDARTWVENNDLLLLLDGLDEVKRDQRDDCVAAINAFRDYSTQMVVCSRTADYQGLTARLHLSGAVLLQPLTPEQIDHYLSGTGPNLVAVRKALECDPALGELAQTPVILSIMTLASRDLSAPGVRVASSVETMRRHLFAAYVQSMFRRRSVGQEYAPGQTIHWLSWLARKMIEQGQTVFLIERLQPDWLDVPRQFPVYLAATVLAVALAAGIPYGLLFGLAGGPLAGLISGLIFALVFGLIGGVLRLRIQSGRVETVDALSWSWTAAWRSLVLGLVFGLVFGLAAELVVYLAWNVVFGLAGALVWLLCFELFFGLGVALFLALFLALKSKPVETTTTPNQGITKSARNGAFVGLGAGLVFGVSDALLVWLIFELFDVQVPGMPGGLVLGLFVGFFFGLFFALVIGLARGGYAVIQHFVLRVLLTRSSHLPWHYARFLDYAADRIFLRKVGGGYIFVHRLLQEYFASLEGATDS